MKRLVAALFLALLTGCASPEYWKAGMFTPVPGPAHVVYTSEMPAGFCDNEALACWIPHTAFVYMLDTLMQSEETCYTHHEVEMHKNRGYGHEQGAMPYDVCGYETLRKAEG